MEDVEFVEKIHIAAYWRKQLGEYDYVNHNPDDLLRWYIALETRGPTEIRHYLIERTSRYHSSVVTGVVSTAPHPPRTIVELWLASREPVRTAPYWTGLLAFCVFGYLAATNLYGCTTLVSPNKLILNPPQTNPPMLATSPLQLPPAASTLPASVPAPLNAASPSSGTPSP